MRDTARFYGNFVIDAGGLFVYNTDISSAVDRLEYGFLLVGGRSGLGGNCNHVSPRGQSRAVDFSGWTPGSMAGTV